MNFRFTAARPAILLAAVGVALAGCASKSGGPAAPATVQPIDNADQIGDVIARLERGDAKAAKKSLETMRKRDPNDARAAMLLESITADPQEILGARSFAYTAKAGDTFPALAQRFLGNRDKFYALARYNGFDNPSALAAGRALRIPGEEPRAAPPPAPKPRPTPPPASKPVTPPPAAKPKPAAPAANPALARQLRSQGLAALNRGEVDRAVVLLHRALAANPGSAVIKADLTRAQRIRKTVKARR
ncbi:LysM domain-containing protein [Sphingomonas gilva]|uniref:LysM domain-containing protein n=1 Tax=Sphingomonas gilva TaxID=2305907 RepID=A0A396RP11_9SPHN|nr:LysM peptidoglycan-binding domain-containing protein [Sphingomonas gilva]RHW16952.1 LysM domain-containing protein [Sphingomonas gilva]